MPDGERDRLTFPSFTPVGWYWNGELHLFEGGDVPNGVAHEYEPEQDSEPFAANEAEHLLYWAWTIIANAGEGNWDREHPSWKKAATDWRDRWHAYLEARKAPE